MSCRLEGRPSTSLGEIVAERIFACPRISRFINIVVQSFASVEEAEHARDHLTDKAKRRYAHANVGPVMESEITLANFPEGRLTEAQGRYMGDGYRLLCITQVHRRDILRIEYLCTATSHWALNDCETALPLRIEKLLQIEEPGITQWRRESPDSARCANEVVNWRR